MELPAGLEGSGPVGTIVWMLLGAISVLSGVVTVLYRANTATTGERIEEMKAFAKILTDNTLAHRESAAATQALSANLRELTNMVAMFAATQTALGQRVDHHHESNIDKLEAHSKVIDSLAAAMRGLSDSVGKRGMIP